MIRRDRSPAAPKRDEVTLTAERDGRPPAQEGLLAQLEQTPAVATTLEEILGYILEGVVLATQSSEGSLMLLHEGRELLTVTSARGPRKGVVRAGRRHLGEGVSGWVAKNRKPLLLLGSVDEDRFAGPRPEIEIKDAMCVPLVADNGVVGVLSVSNKKGDGTFTQENLDQLVELARPHAKIIALTLIQREIDAESSAWARKQLAQEIHDGLLQGLSALILHLSLYESIKEEDSAEALEQLEKSRDQAQSCLQELRHLIFDLRLAEMQQMTLHAELEDYVAEFRGRSGLEAEVTFLGDEVRLPVKVKKNLYRIVQEALTNVRRHAGASRVQVALEYRPQELELTVEDDGRGFDFEGVTRSAQEERHYGLVGIQERTYLLGGSLRIQTAPGEGTRISVVVPL